MIIFLPITAWLLMLLCGILYHAGFNVSPIGYGISLVIMFVIHMIGFFFFPSSSD